MSAESRYPQRPIPTPVQSDPRTRELILQELRNAIDLNSSGMDVYVAEGEATLLGEVDSFRDAKRAIQLAERCLGVTVVYNQLRLVPLFAGYTGDGPVPDGGEAEPSSMDVM